MKFLPLISPMPWMMPQVAPMWWLMLFLFSTFLVLNTLTYISMVNE